MSNAEVARQSSYERLIRQVLQFLNETHGAHLVGIPYKGWCFGLGIDVGAPLPVQIVRQLDNDGLIGWDHSAHLPTYRLTDEGRKRARELAAQTAQTIAQRGQIDEIPLRKPIESAASWAWRTGRATDRKAR